MIDRRPGPAVPRTPSPRPGRPRVLGGGLALATAALVGCGEDRAAPPTAPPEPAPANRKPSGDLVMALVALADQPPGPHPTRTANLAPVTTSCFEQFSRW